MTRADGVSRMLGRRVVIVAGALAVAAVLASPTGSWAVYLDDARKFSLRARLYTETSVATEDSQAQTATPIDRGDIKSHRTFFNPELDGDLTSSLSFLGLDEVKFRMTLWGFYEGLYGYLDDKWRNTALNFQSRESFGRTRTAPYLDANLRRHDTAYLNNRNVPHKVYTYQPDDVLGDFGSPEHVGIIPFRVNELYVSLAKGPASLRIGRQSISWGESDTIAILDQSNPFDLRRGAPGIFQDIDEARIPLWTVRGQLNLFEQWGPFSSVFLDSYFVPGSIDSTVARTPLPGGLSPYSPPESDPQSVVGDLIPPSFEPALSLLFGCGYKNPNPSLPCSVGQGGDGLLVVQYDRLPSRSMANSRGGLRIEGLINRNYTGSLWWYRTMAQTPVPRFGELDMSNSTARVFNDSIEQTGIPDLGNPARQYSQLIVETSHRPVDVFGASLSFYNQLVNGIVRLNAQYHVQEPAFIPSKNLPFQNLIRHPELVQQLGTLGVPVEPGRFDGEVVHADYFRWEMGIDRFFFNRVLNPSNSFVWVSSLVGSWNVTETLGGGDFRYYGQRKATGDPDSPWKSGVNSDVLTDPNLTPQQALTLLATNDKDYVDLHEVEWFIQSTLQTDYFHGRMSPRFTAIVNPRGTYVINPNIQFRFSDRVLFDLRYHALMGGFFTTGFFRDRDQVSLRVTFLLN
jgi:hypothetical protein